MRVIFLCLFMWLSILPSCAQKDFDPERAEYSYQIAKEPYTDGNYEVAITRLGEFKSRFPYSRFAIEAELLLANSQYELRRYAEAGASYKQFAKLHPKHPEVPFALFRIGDTYWKEAPDDIDREQEYTQKAVENWKTLVKEYPENAHAKEATALIEQGTRRLAEAHRFVAAFYCKQQIWHACAYSQIQLAEAFPQYPEMRQVALEQAAAALEKVAIAPRKENEDSNLYYKNFTPAQLKEKAQELRTLAVQVKQHAASAASSHTK